MHPHISLRPLGREIKLPFCLRHGMWWKGGGGISAVARQSHIQRGSLYNALSNRGNPRLTTLQGILKSMGLRMAVIPKTEAA